jgi:hypothetical protein
VKLSTFTSDKPGKSEMMCRAVGMVQTPGGVPFEQYVQDAFRTELLVAGLASDSAPVTLMGHLERMHFSTSTEASWELRVTLAWSHGRRLTIAEDYAFSWHFIGDQVCREAATAMALAVQSLIRKAVRRPEFAGLLAVGAATPAAVSPPPASTPTPATMAPAPASTLAAETAAALAPTPAPSERRPDTRLLNHLRQWAPGKWCSSCGTNVLWIERDLRWSWESSFGGKWSGSGPGEIVDRRLILRGWHSTSIQMSLRLVREGEALVGELQTNRSYPIVFVRE